MTLDPQAAATLEMLRETGIESWPVHLSPDEVRALFEALAPPPEALPHVHSVQDTTVPGPAGDVPVRIYRPSDDLGLPVLVWIHGGGWVLGDLDSGEFPCRRIAAATPCVVMAVDYRLAPEHPYPAAVEDAEAATRWALAELAGGDGARLAVGGDSAGGNLATIVARHLRDDGVELALQVLVYPVTDCDFETDSYRENGAGYLLDLPAMTWFFGHYQPDVEARTDPDCSPLRADDLSGMAPAWVLTAGYDPLRDEGRAYAEALRDAGVEVTHREWEGHIHAFFTMNLAMDGAAEAQDEAAQALREAFAG